MTPLEPLVICVLAASTLLAWLAYLRERRQGRRLRAELVAASEAQRTQTSLLTQRHELDTIKDEFISTVSHELRTPLTSIRGALGLLSAGLMGSMDSKAQNLLRIASTNTDRLIRLINDILDLERMESGRAPLYMRRCSLGELAMQATETMASLADTSEVRLEILVVPQADAGTGEELPDLFFEGDPDRILQVLTNLLSNAIKFSPPKSTVRLELEAGTADTLTLRVRDQGRGIPADKLDFIFERFGQVEASDSRQKGGTGLGLAICRSIVQQHNGRIWAESNSVPGLGRGACLVVTLPRATRAAAGARGRPALSSAEAIEGTILVCDEDPDLRTFVATTLRHSGYAVVEMATGAELLDTVAETAAVSAVLLEVGRPGLLGWSTLRQLKSNPATAAVPIVVLSTQAPMRRSGDLGGFPPPEGWMTKPVNPSTLFTELSRILHKNHGRPQLLLVEDDDDLADVIVASFGAAQVRVDHAATYSEAVVCFSTLRPDLLILDLELPDGDGFILVEWLRQQPGLSSLPLVVYSGREVSETERAHLRLGPTQFLTKAKVQPGEVEELVFKMVQTLRPSPEESEPATLNP